MMWKDWDVIVLWDGEKQMILEKNAVVDADIERQIVLYCSIETFYLEFNREKPAVYDDRLKHKHRQMPIIQRIFWILLVKYKKWIENQKLQSNEWWQQ